eukprot:493541-Amphidinium_carterae.1
MPVVNSWRLNERHYGDLQGKNKAEIAALFGEDQVECARSFLFSFFAFNPQGLALLVSKTSLMETFTVPHHADERPSHGFGGGGWREHEKLFSSSLGHKCIFEGKDLAEKL